jgi:hypothetical protein
MLTFFFIRPLDTDPLQPGITDLITTDSCRSLAHFHNPCRDTKMRTRCVDYSKEI